MIPNAAVARTWIQTASSRFQNRSISALSPGCGPAAVESVPVTTSTPQAPASTSPASRSQTGTGESTRPYAFPHASTATTLAPPRTTSASRKCVATISGCRSSRIVSRPSGACAIVPRKTNAAVQVTQRPSPGVRGAASQASSERVIGKRAKTRLPNSIVECSPSAGKNAPC